jgi:hypothetical protein
MLYLIKDTVSRDAPRRAVTHSASPYRSDLTILNRDELTTSNVRS